MAENNYLALDFGAESGRAITGTLAGGRVTLAENYRFANPNGRINGHYHWNLMAQWEHVKAGLRKAVEARPGLASIGVDTWGVDFGLLDRNDELLGNPFMYRDGRTDGMMEKVFDLVSREQVFEATGVQFMQLNSLFQLMAMRQARSPKLDAADTLLFMPDLFNFLFTGEKVNEFSIATTSQMYDPRARGWARGLLEALDLPAHILRKIVPSGTVVGPLLKDVAEECGVGRLPVIAPGCHDTASAVAAVPAEGEDWAYISSGTWSLMGVELPEPVINAKALKYNCTNEGGVGGRIRFLKNIAGLWLVQECRRQWQREGREYSYAELTKLAGEARPLGALIDPDHRPFMSPGDMPGRIREFCRSTHQGEPASVGEVVRTCLESLALTYRQTLLAMEDILGRKLKVLHIVGGGTQNELLNQMAADACGIRVVAGPIEATAVGNVLTQAMALGDVKSVEELRAIVRASFELKSYQPRDGGRWAEAFERYRQIVGR